VSYLAIVVGAARPVALCRSSVVQHLAKGWSTDPYPDGRPI